MFSILRFCTYIVNCEHQTDHNEPGELQLDWLELNSMCLASTQEEGESCQELQTSFISDSLTRLDYYMINICYKTRRASAVCSRAQGSRRAKRSTRPLCSAAHGFRPPGLSKENRKKKIEYWTCFQELIVEGAKKWLKSTKFIGNFQMLISQARSKLFENFKSLKSSSGHVVSNGNL